MAAISRIRRRPDGKGVSAGWRWSREPCRQRNGVTGNGALSCGNDRAVGRGDGRGQGGAAMGEWWAAAVAAAGEQPPADLPAAAAEELIALWSDLGEAIRRAVGRSWSVECDGLVVRIVTLSRAHHGDAVAVDTGAAAGQRRLSGGAGVSGHRLHPAVHGRDLRRGPPGRDRRAARRHRPPLSCPAAPCPTRAGRALERRFALACRSRGPRRSAGSSCLLLSAGPDSAPGGVRRIPGYARRGAPNATRSAAIQIGGSRTPPTASDRNAASRPLPSMSDPIAEYRRVSNQRPVDRTDARSSCYG